MGGGESNLGDCVDPNLADFDVGRAIVPAIVPESRRRHLRETSGLLTRGRGSAFGISRSRITVCGFPF